jgi:hypothetical protein
VGDGVSIEPDGLHNFSTKVENDTAKTLEPGYTRSSLELSSGVQFGKDNPGGGIHAAKQRYAESLKASTANVEEYVAAAKVLAAAAAKVAKAFEETDTMSADQINRINSALWDAAEEARQRQAAAGGHPTTRGGGQRAI